MLIDRSSYVVPRPKPYAFDHFLPPAGRATDRPRSHLSQPKDDVIHPTNVVLTAEIYSSFMIYKSLFLLVSQDDPALPSSMQITLMHLSSLNRKYP
jgi:hypothetical protein